MKYLVILFLIGLANYGHNRWIEHKAMDSGPEYSESESPNGFVSVAMPLEAKANTVVVFTPLNCPSERAQRSYELAQKLDDLGIPVIKSRSFTLTASEDSPAQKTAIQRAVEVFKQGPPAVFVNGMGKSNPTIEEVVAEYRRTR